MRLIAMAVVLFSVSVARAQTDPEVDPVVPEEPPPAPEQEPPLSDPETDTPDLPTDAVPPEGSAPAPAQPPAEGEKTAPVPEQPAGEQAAPSEESPPPGEPETEREPIFVEPPPEAPKAAEAPLPTGALLCDDRWGCWDLLHTTKGTVLGVRGSVGYVWSERDDNTGAGFMAVYMTEHYATHDYMTVHFAGMGALGGGTDGTEGAVHASLDFGFRAKVSDVSGPFLRAGTQGLFVGHRELNVGILEPLQARAGYQYLKGDFLVEFALTQGFVPIARYQALEGQQDLSRSTEIGGYGAVHVPPLRGSVTFMQLLPSRADESALQVGRFALCSYALDVTLCADLWYTRGRVDVGASRELSQGVYGGITIGLSP